MQFIDQSATYRKKSIHLSQAVSDGRAQVKARPGAALLAECFRPELKIVNNFDKSIDKRLKFDDLPTDGKLDLLAAELLPAIFDPDALPDGDNGIWRVRFLIDGTVERVLHIDASGIHPAPCDDRANDIEIETDVVTLMAILRAAIADYYHKRSIV